MKQPAAYYAKWETLWIATKRAAKRVKQTNNPKTREAYQKIEAKLTTHENSF